MIRKFSLLLSFIMLLVAGANAQNTKPFVSAFGMSWDIEIPVNNSFVDQTSFGGFKFDYRHGISNNLSLGFALGWNRFSEYAPKQTYQITDGAITTDLYTYIYSVPFGPNIHYYFGTGKTLNPFVGATIGANYSQQRIYYNSYYSEDQNWGFLARPEVGLIIQPDRHSGFGILLAASYSYASNQQEQFKVNGLKSFGFQLGVVFTQ